PGAGRQGQAGGLGPYACAEGYFPGEIACQNVRHRSSPTAMIIVLDSVATWASALAPPATFVETRVLTVPPVVNVTGVTMLSWGVSPTPPPYWVKQWAVAPSQISMFGATPPELIELANCTMVVTIQAPAGSSRAGPSYHWPVEGSATSAA